jgi:hypothetical protein
VVIIELCIKLHQFFGASDGGFKLSLPAVNKGTV